MEKDMKDKSREELKELLNEILTFIEDSEDTLWSPLTVNEVSEIIQKEIKNLETGKKVNRNQLIIEFLPTSTFQEISMDNGWSNDYISLSANFDKLINEIN